MNLPWRYGCVIWMAIALLGGATVFPARAAAPEALHELAIAADTIETTENPPGVVARGHVILERGSLRLTARELQYDSASGRGILKGPLVLTGPDFEFTAPTGDFDQVAETLALDQFQGRWGTRAQFAGQRLIFGPRLIAIEQGRVTTCMHPEPDLLVVARRFRYYPASPTLNLTVEGVGVEVLGQTLVSMPAMNGTLGEHREGIDSLIFPAFGFDAYRGFLSSTRLDFNFGEESRGSVPVNFSTGRGLSAGIEHALGLGGGEMSTNARFETPWATGQGGLRAMNAYRWNRADGSHWEVAGDYRADLNGQAVHRIPEVTWLLPYYSLFGVLSYQSEFKAGYLWEDTSGARAPRLRWVAPFNSPTWQLHPNYQTWLAGFPFYNHYGTLPYAGLAMSWNHRQAFGKGLALTETMELNRVVGETPFLHDRVYEADRLRVSLEREWAPHFATTAVGSWSKVGPAGDFGIEDISLAATYRWHCFGLTFAFRPLILGVDFRFHALE